MKQPINQVEVWCNISHIMGKEWNICFVWKFEGLVIYFCYVKWCKIYRKCVHKDKVWKVQSLVCYKFCRVENESKYHFKQWISILSWLREASDLNSYCMIFNVNKERLKAGRENECLSGIYGVIVEIYK